LIQNPPTLVINALVRKPESLVPNDRGPGDYFFRRSASASRLRRAIAFRPSRISLVSARSDSLRALTQQCRATNFITTGVAAGAPRIERLLPIHGENLSQHSLARKRLRPIPTNNLVTFTDSIGFAVPSDIVLQTQR
jgi:hypothetical protein